MASLPGSAAPACLTPGKPQLYSAREGFTSITRFAERPGRRYCRQLPYCYIDGDRGVLAYRGIDIHDQAEHSSFEESCYLLWFGRLPNHAELGELRLNLARERKLNAAIISLLRQAPRMHFPWTCCEPLFLHCRSMTRKKK